LHLQGDLNGLSSSDGHHSRSLSNLSAALRRNDLDQDGVLDQQSTSSRAWIKMSRVIEEIGADDGSTRHDETLHNLLAQHGDDPSRFLATVFAFLQRNTSFLAPPDAQRCVTALLRKVTGAPDASSSGVKSGFFNSPKPVSGISVAELLSK